jgi:hypothetical protein
MRQSGCVSIAGLPKPQEIKQNKNVSVTLFSMNATQTNKHLKNQSISMLWTVHCLTGRIIV